MKMKVDNLWAIIALNKKKINIFLFAPQIVVLSPQIVVFQFFYIHLKAIPHKALKTVDNFGQKYKIINMLKIIKSKTAKIHENHKILAKRFCCYCCC